MEAIALGLYIFIQLLVTAKGQQTTDVSYDEIKQLNATCSGDDRCTDWTIPDWERFDHMQFHRCVCGSVCARYDTCCVDSPHRLRNTSPRSKRGPPVECVLFHHSHRPHYLVTKCHRRWRGSRQVIRNCRSDQGISQPLIDPYVGIPAVDTRSNTTYKNVFCGLCNGVPRRHLVMWDMRINVPEDDSGHRVDKEKFLDQLFYDDSRKKWGFMRNVNGASEFKEVKLDLLPSNYSTICVPDLISECDPAWTDAKIRDKCRAYMLAMFFYPKSGLGGPTPFRNVHCAICNFVDLDSGDFKCQGIHRPYGDPLSFSLLVDVNLRDGPLVGKVVRCKPGESYDKFAKKCRALECGLPGFIRDGRRCVRA